jgi:predicted metal-dependent hydrolase
MAHLLFYAKENVGYAHLTTIEVKKVEGDILKSHLEFRTLSNKNAQLVANKLVHHFHIKDGYHKYPKLLFSNRKKGGCCNPATWVIHLGNNPSLAYVVHEVGHLKYRKHNKKLLNLIGKMLKYCAKNNYWGVC